MHFADSHNHLQQFDDPPAVVEAMRAAGIVGCVTNATTEADWPQVARLAEEFPGFVTPAFGLHPWHAHTATPGWHDRLRDLLERYPGSAVGECGLDRAIDAPELVVQAEIFEVQLAIAREMDRTVIIHCVRAWGALFDSFDRSPAPARMLIHSFGGSPETARRLAGMGAFFSFSGHFLHPHRAGVVETFRGLPRDRLLVETDAPDMLPPGEMVTHPLPGGRNHPANLAAITAALADHLGLTTSGLAALTLCNHRVCFAP